MKLSEYWFPGRLRDLTRAECIDLLAERHVGRVAYCDETGPVVLPVNYVLDGDDVVIVTSPDSALALHLRSAAASFEIDEYDDYTLSGWSVLVRDSARYMGCEDMPLPSTRPHAWAEGQRNLYIRITTKEITGRRLLGS